jgi:hypothetical protein
MTKAFIHSLPPPPSGKTGWPWTEETPAAVRALPGGRPWPRISVVTPSYNQGEYLEETIRSVLLQGYPNLEYVVIDGGSSDGSVEILRKYEPWVARWLSEKDRGQAHAINKGLAEATGEVAAYLNSDDYYLPGALQHVARSWAAKRFDVFVGRQKRVGQAPPPRPSWFLLRRSWWLSLHRPFVHPFVVGRPWHYELPQECIFWNHRRYQHMTLDESFRFCLDAEWFIRLYSGARVVHSSRRVGVFRIHPTSKTTQIQEVYRRELDRIHELHGSRMDSVTDGARKAIIRSFRLAKVVALVRAAVGLSPSYFCYTHPAYPADRSVEREGLASSR